MKEKIVLAYSGGLDTSVIVPWLKENYEAEIIAVCVDVGQVEDFDKLKERAISIGASSCYVIDVKEDFIKNYVFDMIKSGAKYENKYLLGTAIARPLISKVLADIAIKEKAKYICHGATGKGNDQVRFELGIKALAPHVEIIAPWRIWDIKSRKDEIKYLKSHGINLPFEETKTYSRDENLLHISHEGSDLEDIKKIPDYSNILKWTKILENTPDIAEYIEIEFEKGEVKKLNGKEYLPVELFEILNKIGSKHGIGVIDLVENRLVGMKSRGVYESPAGTLIYFAHDELERVCLDKDLYHQKTLLSFEYANLIYNGKWFSSLRKALSVFFNYSQEYVNGKVKLKLYKGNIVLSGIESNTALYHEEYSTFDEDQVYDQADAKGFINLFGLSTKIEAILRNKEK